MMNMIIIPRSGLRSGNAVPSSIPGCFPAEIQSLLSRSEEIQNVIVIVTTFKFLKRHSKAKPRAPAYSRTLLQNRGVVQRIVRGRLRSDCQRVNGGTFFITLEKTLVIQRA